MASLLATMMLLSSGLARPQTLACHVSYGGETLILRTPPVASPYGVPMRAIGSYFLFRMVFQTAPPDLAAIKVYVFGEREGEPVPIHQATYPYPPREQGAGYGFTGLQAVYEPVRDGEIQYQSSQVSISAYFARSLVSAVVLRQNRSVTNCL